MLVLHWCWVEWTLQDLTCIRFILMAVLINCHMLRWVSTCMIHKKTSYQMISYLTGSGSLAAMAVFESRYRPNMEVNTLWVHSHWSVYMLFSGRWSEATCAWCHCCRNIQWSGNWMHSMFAYTHTTYLTQHTHSHMYVHRHTHTYTRTYMHAHTYLHTYTHTHI